MKLIKFGTITEVDGEIIMDGFNFDAEGGILCAKTAARCVISRVEKDLENNAEFINLNTKSNQST